LAHFLTAAGCAICSYSTKCLDRFEGSAGQSFGCFLTPGMHIRLVGEANDYVAKVSLPECLLFTSLKCLSVDFQIQSCF